jgi:hypothetical protein
MSREKSSLGLSVFLFGFGQARLNMLDYDLDSPGPHAQKPDGRRQFAALDCPLDRLRVSVKNLGQVIQADYGVVSSRA